MPPQHQAAAAKASPVTGIKFRQGSAGLRIEFTAAEPTPVVLALRGESLASFGDLVARLAAKAKWDLDAALLRISQTPAAPKRMLH